MKKKNKIIIKPFLFVKNETISKKLVEEREDTFQYSHELIVSLDYLFAFFFF